MGQHGPRRVQIIRITCTKIEAMLDMAPLSRRSQRGDDSLDKVTPRKAEPVIPTTAAAVDKPVLRSALFRTVLYGATENAELIEVRWPR